MAKKPPTPAKSWQHRLGARTDPAAAELLASIDVDAALYKYDIAGSIAHAQMLRENLRRLECLGLRAGEHLQRRVALQLTGKPCCRRSPGWRQVPVRSRNILFNFGHRVSDEDQVAHANVAQRPG